MTLRLGLQHIVTLCNTLQHTAAHCDTLQHTATYQQPPHIWNTTQQRDQPREPHRNILKHCNTLQHTATYCSTLQHTAIYLQPPYIWKMTRQKNRHRETHRNIPKHCNTLQHTAAHCSTLQYTCNPHIFGKWHGKETAAEKHIKRHPICAGELSLAAKSSQQLALEVSYIVLATRSTGWRRPIGCLKLQVIFRKRATNCRALWREMTSTGKDAYGSSPLSSKQTCVSFLRETT